LLIATALDATAPNVFAVLVVFGQERVITTFANQCVSTEIDGVVKIAGGVDIVEGVCMNTAKDASS